MLTKAAGLESWCGQGAALAWAGGSAAVPAPVCWAGEGAAAGEGGCPVCGRGRTGLRGFGLGDKTRQRERQGRRERGISLVNYAFRNIMNKRLGAGDILHSDALFLDFFSERT